MKYAFLLLGLVGCLQEHSPTTIEVRIETHCYECHRTDYELAANHSARSTTCADCHRLRDWKGINGGVHPEARFVIGHGPHAAVMCADCHDPDISPDSTRGLNVSCIGCHTGAHSMARMQDKHHEQAGYRWDPARPAFCRDCHPRGLGDD